MITTALADVEINETTFPDENFRNWVLAQEYGKDGGLTEEEIAGIATIIVVDKNIQSLKGIEYFTKLTSLDCNGNQLTELDISKNLELIKLYCHENQLTELDVSKNTALKRIWCSENLLTSLDVSGCTLLESLKCVRNRLTTLKVSGCPELEEVYCYSNQIKGEAMDALIAGLPNTSVGHLPIISLENEQNVMTKAQVAAAKAKGWIPRYKYGSFGNNFWTEYEGSDEGTGVASPIWKTEEGSLFDLQGRMIDKPQQGLNIIRYSDGSTKKVLVK